MKTVKTIAKNHHTDIKSRWYCLKMWDLFRSSGV